MGRFYAQKTDEVTVLERTNQEIVRALAGECMVLLEMMERCRLEHWPERRSPYMETEQDIRSRAEPDRVM